MSIPVDRTARQLSSSGDLTPLNVGGVLALPEGFHSVGLADSGLTLPFNSGLANQLVFGPQPSQLYSEVVISCQADRDLPYLNYPVVAGGNRGRGQIYPDGELSNNNSFRSQSTGVIVRKHYSRGGSGTNIALGRSSNEISIQHVPAGLSFVPGFNPGALVGSDSALTNNPNVGGFSIHCCTTACTNYLPTVANCYGHGNSALARSKGETGWMRDRYLLVNPEATCSAWKKQYERSQLAGE